MPAWHLLSDPQAPFHDLGAGFYDTRIGSERAQAQPHPPAGGPRLQGHPRTRRRIRASPGHCPCLLTVDFRIRPHNWLNFLRCHGQTSTSDPARLTAAARSSGPAASPKGVRVTALSGTLVQADSGTRASTPGCRVGRRGRRCTAPAWPGGRAGSARSRPRSCPAGRRGCCGGCTAPRRCGLG